MHLNCSFTQISEFKGLVFKNVYHYNSTGQDNITFITEDDVIYEMTHIQDCCEDVSIESIVGELSDLIDSPILLAEEVCEVSDHDQDKSYTYTFYKLATIKGYVDIRWYGTSNGFYNERVDIIKIIFPSKEMSS